MTDVSETTEPTPPGTDEQRRAANLAVLRDMFAALADRDVDRMATFWADDLVFEAPISFTGSPSRTEGKPAVYDRLSRSYGRVHMRFTITKVYDLLDPDTLIVEYTSEGRMVETGQPYENSYITVFRFRDGKLTLFREFYDSLKVAAAFG